MAGTLFYNGDILTMEDGKETVEAVLVQDGKIAKVGTAEQLKVMAPDAELVDLQGKTLMPSFIDAHGHYSGYAIALLQVDLVECVNHQEVIDTLKKFIGQNNIPAGQWISCKGYDHNIMAEKTPPRKDVLDQGAPDNPVICAHKSGHAGVFNSKALEELGITAETKAPDGGVIEMKDGQPTGYMEENAFLDYQQRTPMMDMGAMLKAFVDIQERYASYGVTTVQDGMVVEMMKDLYGYLHNADMFKLDVVGYWDSRCSKEMRQQFSMCEGRYNKRLKFGGYKIFLDGSPQAETAWMRTKYPTHEEDYYGYPVMKDEDIIAICKKALQEDRQILAHCNGDAAAQQYLDCYQKAKDELGTTNDIRPVLVHGQLLGLDQLPQLKALGIIPTFFVAHVWHWGMIHMNTFGKERAQTISPAGSALKEGIKFTFHQDAPVIDPDMLETVWCAVNRVTKNGKVIGEGEKVPVYEALKAVTINGAYQYFEEDVKGSIKEGKLADLIILDKNPLKVPAMEIKDILVLETFKDGNRIYKR